MLPLLAVLCIAKFGQRPQQQDVLLQQAQLAAAALPAELMLNERQNGIALLSQGNISLSEQDINDAIVRNRADMTVSRAWPDGNNQIAMLSAIGLDRRQHFANSYLVGVRPFITDNDWLPLYVLARRKVYQLDSEQYGVDEMWQNSAQAFQLLRGDCEDHALVLADWLISEGLDARVVVGRYKDQGHAWVVVFKESQVFLLEATDKRAGKSWNHYPLAALAEHYHPEFMFNRTQFWTNTGSRFTRQYSGANWRQSANFSRI